MKFYPSCELLMKPYYLLLSAALLAACGGESPTSPNVDQSSDSVATATSSSSVSSSSGAVDGPTSSEVETGLSSGEVDSAGSNNPASSSSVAASGDVYVDSRDGQTYSIYRNDIQTWLGQNMNYNAEPNWCYNDDPANCEEFGRYYSWESAQEACPEGYRLPMKRDWVTLDKLNSTAGMMPINGALTSKNGIALQFGGQYSTVNGKAKWDDMGVFGMYWDYEETTETTVSSMIVSENWVVVYSGNDSREKTDRMSVRCIRENHGTMVDPRDGQEYKTIRLGERIWMAENLNFKTDSSAANPKAEEQGMKVGQYYRRNDAENACPSGWRLPATAEWKMLVDLVDSMVVEDGRSLKSLDGWTMAHTGKDDFEIGLQPAGDCYIGVLDSLFNCGSLGNIAEYWTSSTQVTNGNHECLYMYSGKTLVDYKCNKSNYLPVRCVKE